MTGGDQADIDAIDAGRFAIGHGLGVAGEVLAIAFGHDGQGLGRGQDRAVAGAGVVGVAVGDDGAVHRPGRVDVEVARLAPQALGRRSKQGLGLEGGSRHGLQ